MLCVHTLKAIWRNWRLPDRRKQPVCSHHLQVESRGRAGWSAISDILSYFWIQNVVLGLLFFWRFIEWNISHFNLSSHRAPCSSSVCQAALHGVKLNNQMLRLAWHKVVPLSPVDADEAEPEEDEVCGQMPLCLHLKMSLSRHDWSFILQHFYWS